METTVVNICSWNYYIQWNKEGTRGIDQKGGEWINRESPECITPGHIDKALDAYNYILEKMAGF